MVGITRAEPGVKPPRRRRLLPPPRGRHGAFEGARILDEIGGELGALLFQRSRDVILWAQTPYELRDGLFADSRRGAAGRRRGAGAPGGEIAAELQVLDELVARPDRSDAERVANACAGIYHWAIDRVFYGTAAQFAAAGADVLPHDAMFAVYAGRAERARSAFDIATMWFQRAIALARTSGKMAPYTVALLSWAKQENNRGNKQRARSLLLAAWRYAKRNKLANLGAEARHDLLALSIDEEDWIEAEAHADAACKLYGSRARNIFALAHDWALVWLKQGYFSSALPVMEAVVPYLMAPSARVLALSSIARAAAVLGQMELYRSAADSVVGLAAVATENAPIALVHIAQAAHNAGDVPRARELAARAREIARGREDSTAEHYAVALLAVLENGGPPEQDRLPPAGSAIPGQASMLLERARHLAPLM
jgi:tetratricopeptide (TPR) repeat protein